MTDQTFSISEISWGPNSKLIAFLHSEDPKSIFVYTLETKAFEKKVTFPLPISTLQWSKKGGLIVFSASVFPGMTMEQTLDYNTQREKYGSDVIAFDQAPVYFWDHYVTVCTLSSNTLFCYLFFFCFVVTGCIRPPFLHRRDTRHFCLFRSTKRHHEELGRRLPRKVVWIKQRFCHFTRRWSDCLFSKSMNRYSIFSANTYLYIFCCSKWRTIVFDLWRNWNAYETHFLSKWSPFGFF